jgi:exopolysaccharide production protein ExoQ
LGSDSWERLLLVTNANQFTPLNVYLDNLILGSVFVLSITRASVFFFLYFLNRTLIPKEFSWVIILLWGGILILIFRFVLIEKQINILLNKLRSSKALLLFLAFAGISIFWSDLFYATLFHWFEFLFSTLVALYFAVRYKFSFFTENLLKAGILVVLINIIFSIMVPSLSSPPGYPYYGAWRGIFWHKNHLGTFVAFFNLLCLFFAFYYYKLNRREYLLWSGAYLITFAVAFFSKSATALLVIFILSSCFFLLQVWLLIHPKLKAIHYSLLAGLFIFLAILIYINLEFLFALAGKDITLTGRLDLWKYLFEHVINKRILLGHGFGAFWEIPSNRLYISQVLGWGFEILIGDNGFIDIFVNLGIIGFSLFLIIFISAWVRALQIAYKNLTHPLAFLPLFILAYVILANTTFTILLETEMLVWIFILQIYFVQSTSDFFENTTRQG